MRLNAAVFGSIRHPSLRHDGEITRVKDWENGVAVDFPQPNLSSPFGRASNPNPKLTPLTETEQAP